MPDQRKPEIELHPDGWERFQRALKAIGKAGPQHREKPKRRPARKGRVHKGKPRA